MKILYSPQRNENKLIYTFNDEIITVSLQESTGQMIEGELQKNWNEIASDTFDFSSSPDGELTDIETTLPVNPIMKAERTEGVLSLTLLSYIGADATEEEKFPEWVVI